MMAVDGDLTDYQQGQNRLAAAPTSFLSVLSKIPMAILLQKFDEAGNF
jgi:hypothetical protein